MISGSTTAGTVVEESICRSAEDVRFTSIGVYKIHANVLMANIKFGEAKEYPETIKSGVFLNENKLRLPTTIQCQNYLTTKYVGRAPLEFYSGNNKTERGREFLLLCRDGDPSEDYRTFGTEDAIHGVNANASELSKISGGD